MGGKGSGGRRGEASRRPSRRPVALAKDRKPYERQPRETDKAWQAFLTYRDDPKRTLAKAAAKLGKSKQLIEQWNGRWRWRERVEAWDREQDDAGRNAKLDEIARMNRRQARLGRLMQKLARKGLEQRKEAGEVPEVDDARKLADTGTRIERVARGEPSEHHKVETTQSIVIGGKEIDF